MNLARMAVVPLLLASAPFTCQVQDYEARTYVNGELAHYLDSAAALVCRIKYEKAPAASGRVICPAQGVAGQQAPVNGDPGNTSDKKDSEARAYIRYKLEPYLDSLAYQLCHVKFAAAPQAPGGTICPGPPEGYTKPPGNGAP